MAPFRNLFRPILVRLWASGEDSGQVSGRPEGGVVDAPCALGSSITPHSDALRLEEACHAGIVCGRSRRAPPATLGALACMLVDPIDGGTSTSGPLRGYANIAIPMPDSARHPCSGIGWSNSTQSDEMLPGRGSRADILCTCLSRTPQARVRALNLHGDSIDGRKSRRGGSLCGAKACRRCPMVASGVSLHPTFRFGTDVECGLSAERVTRKRIDHPSPPRDTS